METMDDLYACKEILNNILLLKVAHRAGVDMNVFHSYIPNEFYGFDQSWELFITAITNLFEQSDFIAPYDDEAEVIETKSYWLNLAKQESQEDYKGLVIILDDRIPQFDDSYVGGYTISNWYTGYAEIHSIEKGIVIEYDEEDGAIDWTDVFAFLAQVLERGTRNKEELTNEVAV